MGAARPAEGGLTPALQAELAGWRCDLDADTAEGRLRLASAFARLLAPRRDGVLARLGVELAGPTPTVRLAGTHGPCGLEDLFRGPEWRRFAPVAPAQPRRYVDTVLGGPPAIEALDDGFAVLHAELWPLYALLSFLGLMVRDHPVAWLHAAVCAAGGRALVLIGPSGSGKSTLCGALHRQGADYHGDELAFFALPHYTLSVWPRALYLRPGGLQVLGGVPGALEWHEAKPDDPKCIVPLAEAGRPCPSADIVLCFLDPFAGAPAIRRMPGGEGVRHLLAGLSLGDPSISRRLEICAGLISRYPGWRVTPGPPDATAEMLLREAGALG